MHIALHSIQPPVYFPLWYTWMSPDTASSAVEELLDVVNSMILDHGCAVLEFPGADPGKSMEAV
jgi:hypothetical protein